MTPAVTIVSSTPKRKNHPIEYHPALLALVIATASISPGFVPGTAIAADDLPVEVLAQASQTRFAIASGPMAVVLNRFASAAGITLSFDPAKVETLNSDGIRGSYSVDEALRVLLAGTGLQANRTTSGGYMVTAPDDANGAMTLPPVTVSAAAERSGDTGTAAEAYHVGSTKVGVLGEQPLKDTPYSIDVYSHELIENKQARSLADITKGDASISLMTDDLVTENNTLAIRGIEPDLDTGKKINGLSTRLRANDLPLEHLEQVEILKGAGGYLYGFGAPGGIINYVLKRPTDEPLTSVSTQVMDSGLALVHGDLGRRFGTNNALGFRGNLVHESGDTYIDDGESRRNSGSAVFDWRITPDLVWQIDALTGKHLRDGGYWTLHPDADGEVSGDIGAPPDPIDGSKRIAPSFSRYGSEIETFGTELSWGFTPDWDFSLSHRTTENGRQYLMPSVYADAQGEYSMSFVNYANRFNSQQSQGLITGEFTTGSILHNFSAGASYTRTSDKWSEDAYERLVTGSGNLSDPAEFANPFSRYVDFDEATTEYSRVRRQELFASDILHYGDNWDFVLGLRHGTLENKYTEYDESATTPTVAAVFRPVQSLSLYGSYIEALEEGATAPAEAANAFEIFKPLVSKQYEIGAKMEGSDWSANLALFHLERGLTYTTSENIFTQDGEARYQGLELSGKFSVTPQWIITASTMWLDATNQETGDSTLDGQNIQGVARHQASLYSEYRLAGLPLTFTAGARYIGERPVDAGNQWDVDAVALFDLGARYETRVAGNALTLRLNLDNVSDEAYWVTRYGTDSLQQGTPRIIKLSAQIDF